MRAASSYYILRPEAVESFFVLWRTTHEDKYRDYGWQVATAINNTCRVENGFWYVGVGVGVLACACVRMLVCLCVCLCACACGEVSNDIGALVFLIRLRVFSGIRDVTRTPADLDDTQQSFFFAETLKYLYLLFSPNDHIDLTEFVFNTEVRFLAIHTFLFLFVFVFIFIRMRLFIILKTAFHLILIQSIFIFFNVLIRFCSIAFFRRIQFEFTKSHSRNGNTFLRPLLLSKQCSAHFSHRTEIFLLLNVTRKTLCTKCK